MTTTYIGFLDEITESYRLLITTAPIIKLESPKVFFPRGAFCNLHSGRMYLDPPNTRFVEPGQPGYLGPQQLSQRPPDGVEVIFMGRTRRGNFLLEIIR